MSAAATAAIPSASSSTTAAQATRHKSEQLCIRVSQTFNCPHRRTSRRHRWRRHQRCRLHGPDWPMPYRLSAEAAENVGCEAEREVRRHLPVPTLAGRRILKCIRLEPASPPYEAASSYFSTGEYIAAHLHGDLVFLRVRHCGNGRKEGKEETSGRGFPAPRRAHARCRAPPAAGRDSSFCAVVHGLGYRLGEQVYHDRRSHKYYGVGPATVKVD